MDALTLFAKLMQRERWDEACDVARNAMASQPVSPLWPMLCSRAHAAAGRYAEAAAYARAAQDLEDASPANGTETMAAMWFSTGLAALLHQAAPAALEALKKAHALDPDFPGIAPHLALAAQFSHDYPAAVAMYRRVLAQTPEDGQARSNLCLCLMETGAHNEARALVNAWPEDARASVEYALSSARLMEREGNHAGCLALLDASGRGTAPPEQAAMLDVLRGRCLRALGNEEESLAAFAGALEKDPSSFSAANENWMTLQAMGRSPEAEAVLDRFAGKNGLDPLLAAKRAFHVPAILQSAGQADGIRRRIREFVERFGDGHGGTHPTLGQLSEVIDSPPFYLAFHNRDDKELLRFMADFLIRHTADGAGMPGGLSCPGRAADGMAASLEERLAALRPGNALRIGFASRFFTNHTIMSYFFRLLYDLCPRFPRCYILEFPQADNPFRRDLAERATLVTLPARPEAARAAVRELGLDILVYTDLGMDPLTWVLAFSRLATVQCALYGHPATTGIPAIDFFLSPAVMEPENARTQYSETLRTFPGLLCGFIPPPAPGAVPSKPPGNPAGETVYLCAQSLFKVHPDMDGVLRHILSSDRTAAVHFFASRKAHETKAFQDRLRRALPECHERVRLLPQCSEEAFLGHLRGADAVLDTPHFSGGSTSFKALGTGIPVVTMEGRFMRGRQTAGLYRHLGVAGLTADSPEAFGELALRAAHSPAFRETKRREILAVKERLFSLESVDHLEEFFKQLSGSLAE